LSSADRRDIEILLDRGYSISNIARTFKRPKSVIWYELQKSRKGRRYDAEYARRISRVRMRAKRKEGKKIASHSELRVFVERHLMDDQEPEEIARRLRNVEMDLPYVSGSAMRRYIRSPYGRRIEAHRRKVFGRRNRRTGRRKRLKDRRTIHERPMKINRRWGLGHFEGDFIVSGKSGTGMVLGLRDRKVRRNLLEKILPVSVRNVERALVRMKKRYPEMQTITFDNDLLLLEHRRLETVLGIRIYFCDEHSPWQKPSIEQLNKSLRRYIPKGADISRYSRKFIHRLEEKMNRRFMGVLDSLTPDEAYAREQRRKQRLAARLNRNHECSN